MTSRILEPDAPTYDELRRKVRRMRISYSLAIVIFAALVSFYHQADIESHVTIERAHCDLLLLEDR